MYDAADDASKSYDVAIDAMREQLEACERVQIGDATLYCGDCRVILPTLGKVDITISDPPYGKDATHAGHLSKITLRNGEAAGQPLAFSGIDAKDLLGLAEQWVRISNRWVVFTVEWKHAHKLDEAGVLVRLGIWRKPDGAPQFTGDRPGMGWEAVAICHRSGKKHWNGGGSHAYWSVPKQGAEGGHPTGKPIGLMAQFVRLFSDLDETILDPFMGSGTTGVACAKLGRRFIGVEIEPRYFDIACRRIEEAYRQPDLFVAPPAPPAEQTVMDV